MPESPSIPAWRIIVELSAFASILWEIAGRASDSVEFAIGRPSLVFLALIELCKDWVLPEMTAVTSGEILSGLLIGTILGMTVGVVLWFWPRVGEAVSPLVVMASAVPIIAFAPALIFIIGTGWWLKVVVAALASFFVALPNSYAGAQKVRDEQVEFLLPEQVNPRVFFRKVILPASLADVLSSLRLSVASAVLGVFIGEFISSDKGLGYLITRSVALYNMPRAIAAALALSALAVALDQAAAWVQRRSPYLSQLISVPRALR